ncbi:FCD domain-containing protein [Corynebacterium sp.]|uniref:FCD domain-containing protein n=1 Tax=Corynebacterium sp. TaxID=1720 RepID=UPI0028A7F1EB|nr:FCD domain-containing protein [Corynebacterium sp.]
MDVSCLLSATHNSIESLKQGDLEALGENNQKFHRALVTAAGSQTLNQEMNNLLARVRLSWLQVLPSYPSLHSKNVEENAKIAKLLASGQRYEAAELVHTNLMINLYRILGALRTAQNVRKHKCKEKEKEIDVSFPAAEIKFEPPTMQ